MKNIKQNLTLSKLAAAVAGTLIASPLFAAEEVKMSPGVKMTDYDETVFKANPPGPETYDYEAQLEIYGGKRQVPTPRPLIEWGRDIYNNGTFREESYIFGPTNPTVNQFTAHGDVRTAIAHNDAGQGFNRAAIKATIDFDWKLTATERIHFAITPFDDGNDITRIDFGSTSVAPEDEELVIDLNADSFFFEGDLGAITAGLAGTYPSFDLPIAFGLMPLQFQNAIWMDDAITGVAASIISRNSPTLDISNYDITFFAGFDDVDSPFVDANGERVDTQVSVFGIATFFDAMKGYWEFDYAYTDARDDTLQDQSYHNFAIGFTRRYGAWLSNSTRLIVNAGQDQAAGTETADGVLFLFENSLITSKPYTLVPYLNLFYAKDTVQSVARADAAGGILKNVGINFESDNMTGYPAMVANANNMWGGALGIQYLFALDRQLVFELAFSDVADDNKASALGLTGQQLAAGVRYQHNLNYKWLVRFDAMYLTNDLIDDSFGYRIEIRRKF